MLTRKQRDLLEFIHKRVQRDGVPPSFDEMKEALDLRSKSGIHRLITALEDAWLHPAAGASGARDRDREDARGDGTARLLAARDRGRQAVPAAKPAGAMPVSGASATDVPVMGRIAAGTPIEAISEVASHVAVPQQMLGAGRSHYALEVRGDSMIEAGINDGDVVVIEEGAAADNGDIVVALVEGQEATLKRYRRKGGMIALEAANPAYETRVLREDQVTVQGKLVGLIRTY
jgi:repressor LexA